MRYVTVQSLTSLLMLPLKGPAAWIMDLVTWISVHQQLDCTIKEFHIGHLHRGWVEQQSEAWERVVQIGNGVVPSKIIFCLFSEHLCLWQRLMLQPLMPIPGWAISVCRLPLPVWWTELLCGGKCAKLALCNKFMWVAGLTACGEAISSSGQSVYDACE